MNCTYWQTLQDGGDSSEIQYQIVKRKRGRPPKTSVSDTTVGLTSPRGHPTVPPLKIRLVEKVIRIFLTI